MVAGFLRSIMIDLLPTGAATETGALIDGEPRLLAGWGRTARSRAVVVRPPDPAALAAALAGAPPRGVLARGLGRAYGDAALNAGGAVLDMTALSGIHSFDPAAGVVTVGAGTSLETVVSAVAPHGWFPPVVPGTRWVTVGGAIAADVHGKNHHVDGGFARFVERFTLMAPDGDVREISRTEHPETFDATAGGMGLTGVILAATLRLAPLPSGLVREEIRRVEDLDAMLARMAADDDEHRYSVAWVDAAARGKRLGRGLLLRGEHAGAEEAGGAALASLAPPRVRAPRMVPAGLLGTPTVTAFNALWYLVKPRTARHGLTPLAGYFWPLDGVRGWNRLYGRDGLIQYQCVVPPGAEFVLRDILAAGRNAGAVSPLAVLKRLGASEGPLAFPMEGWTLALDLPAAPRLGRLLDEFDARVAAAGGRIYLAKDSRIRPDALAAMYPRLDEWRAVRARLDPGGVLRSDMQRRLGL
jgi:decaprenylphospho-beta-D-ribofuranose 2-oxidase